MDSSPHRIVIKLGTGLLTEAGGTGLDVRQFRRLTYEVADLVQRGVQCVIVTSGAVGAGLMALGLTERPKELASIQTAFLTRRLLGC